MRKIFLFIVFVELNFLGLSQNKLVEENDFSEERIVIHGLTEEVGLGYIEYLLKDTNNIVIFENRPFFFAKGIEYGYNEVFSWEEPECTRCNNLIGDFAKTNRFFEYPAFSKYHYFDTFSLKKANQDLYQNLEKKYQIDFSKKSIIGLSDSLKMELLVDLKEAYNLRELDSLLLIHTFLGTSPSLETIKKISGGKKVYSLKTIMYYNYAELNQLLKIRNGQFIVARTGDSKIKYSNLKFKNRVTEKMNYTLLSFEELPSKVFLLKNFSVPKEFFKKNKAVFVSKLNECAR